MEQGDSREFEKELKDADIKQKLAVPTDFVRRNGLADKQVLQVLDFGAENRNRHAFELSIRGTGPYMKPVFQARGWRQFVKQNDLRAGDVIRFWMRDDQKSFGIQVIERNFLVRFDHAATGPN